MSRSWGMFRLSGWPIFKQPELASPNRKALAGSFGDASSRRCLLYPMYELPHGIAVEIEAIVEI